MYYRDADLFTGSPSAVSNFIKRRTEGVNPWPGAGTVIRYTVHKRKKNRSANKEGPYRALC